MGVCESCARGSYQNLEEGGARPDQQSVADLPNPEPVAVTDPQTGKEIRIIGFHYPDKDELVDGVCQASFLGNFFDVSPDELKLRAPGSPEEHSFLNAFAAFEALQFWEIAADFKMLTGTLAFEKRISQRKQADKTYAGFESEWKAMRGVIEAKFQVPAMAKALIGTQDAFLVNHHQAHSMVWADNGDGQGSNGLGILLMLKRDELIYGKRPASKGSWTEFIQTDIDLETGVPNAQGTGDLQRMIGLASKTLDEKMIREYGQASLETPRAKADGGCCTRCLSFFSAPHAQDQRNILVNS